MAIGFVIVKASDGKAIFSKWFENIANDSQRQLAIACQVKQHFDFSNESGYGVFHLQELFLTDMMIIWRACYADIIMVFVCDKSENPVAALHVLQILPFVLNELPGKNDVEKSIISSPQVLLLALHYFVPNGLILYLLPDVINELLGKVKSHLVCA
mmetsp:Transcript_19477/g.42164  ORF Transcript_19477/g.42164 Transcript_19477/m.42164 type:complete len:156 (-) Transcript_19477:2990-3457(-)